MLTGPDASHHQGVIDWAAVKRAGHTYAFIKATEGASYPFVSWFVQNWGQLKASGLVPGAYHFLRSEMDPVAQARYFVKTVGSFAGVLAAVDVETGGANGTSMPNAGQARNFAAEFHRLVPNHPLLLYTGRWYWVGRLGNPTGADIGPLWDSKYGPSPGTPYGGWSVPTLWQHTNTGTCPGISGPCDLNLFNGDRAALLALTGSPQEADVPLDESDLNAIVAKLNPFLERASNEAAKKSMHFVTGHTNTLFDPTVPGNEWMGDKNLVTLNEVARPADLAGMPAACADAVVRAVADYLNGLPPGTVVDYVKVKEAVKQGLREGTGTP